MDMVSNVAFSQCYSFTPGLAGPGSTCLLLEIPLFSIYLLNLPHGLQTSQASDVEL